MHAARLAMVEAAVLALLREVSDEPGGPDRVEVSAHLTFEGRAEVEVQYLRAGRPHSGESL